jgi:hypothetical protein
MSMSFAFATECADEASKLALFFSGKRVCEARLLKLAFQI